MCDDDIFQAGCSVGWGWVGIILIRIINKTPTAEGGCNNECALDSTADAAAAAPTTVTGEK